MKKLLSIIMCGLILSGAACSLSGCGAITSDDGETSSVHSSQGTSGTPDSASSQTLHTSQVSDMDEESVKKVREEISGFSTILFKEMYATKEKGENTLVSPFSVFTALSLLSNGANEKTAVEITDVLSGYYNTGDGTTFYDEYNPLTTEELNSYFHNYMAGINTGYDDVVTKLSMANSVWAFEREDLSFKQNFFDISENYYNAQLFSEEISKSTVNKINNWVSENTDGMIDEIIEDLSPDSVACLINALAFEGEWESTYTAEDVYTDEFEDYFGNSTDVEYMSSTERYYIDDGNAVGFIKNYSGNGNIQYENEFDDGGAVKHEEPRYCFVALMPNEGTTIDEYVNTMDYDTISNAVKNAKSTTVYAHLPKFEFDDGINFNEILVDLGIQSAFAPMSADFSNLATSSGNIYVSDVIHRTHITVDEEGTKAAAATAIIMQDNAAAILEEESYLVKLDRPFVFAIYDYEEEIPVFVGVLRTI